MKPIPITFKVNEQHDTRNIRMEVLDESGDARDAYTLSIAAAGELSRRLSDACTNIIMIEGSKLVDNQISCVSGRH